MATHLVSALSVWRGLVAAVGAVAAGPAENARAEAVVYGVVPKVRRGVGPDIAVARVVPCRWSEWWGHEFRGVVTRVVSCGMARQIAAAINSAAQPPVSSTHQYEVEMPEPWAEFHASHDMNSVAKLGRAFKGQTTCSLGGHSKVRNTYLGTFQPSMMAFALVTASSVEDGCPYQCHA